MIQHLCTQICILTISKIIYLQTYMRLLVLNCHSNTSHFSAKKLAFHRTTQVL